MKKHPVTANMTTAALFLNTCFNHPRVSWTNCVHNVSGITEFRVPSFAWPKGEAFRRAYAELAKVLGEATVTEFETEKSMAEWNFGGGRTLTLRWKKDEGTFARLTDMNHVET